MFQQRPIKKEEIDPDPSTTFVNVSFKIKREEEIDDTEEHKEIKYNIPHISEEKEEKEQKKARAKSILPKELKCGPSLRVAKQSSSKPINAEHREKLLTELKYLAGLHKWKEASGVFSVYLQANPRATSLEDDRTVFLIAMEILRRRGGKRNYERNIKLLFEVWLTKLTWLKKCPEKKQMVMLQYTLFFISEGKYDAAYDITRLLVQEHTLKKEPALIFMHGLLSYHIWYLTNIPREMQIVNIDSYMKEEASRMSCGSYEKLDASESSNDQNALNIEEQDGRCHSLCASESSVRNNKGDLINASDRPAKKRKVNALHAAEFYVSGSESDEESDVTTPACQANLERTSIFLAQGLDAVLLPIRLNQLHEDLTQCIVSYRKLAKNETYKDAVQYLREALYFRHPPFISVLEPLIQILLLGDRVEEAVHEVENCCRVSDDARPFSLRARLLECFASNQTETIISCWEETLRRDPTSTLAVKKLIRMHRIGNYSTMNLTEMIAKHLDAAADAKSVVSIVWQELASCFLKLQSIEASDYEDRISVNKQRGGYTSAIPSSKIPLVFSNNRGTWIARFKSWMNCHFSKANCSKTRIGVHKLTTFKAACACHIYGPNVEYVQQVYKTIWTSGLSDNIRFLDAHLQNSLKLQEKLAGASSS